jgi:2-amino-4-hydroxy-6-hydroxymethyldihydropteridine diphosphokinase/dihydropteroate synthase
MVILGLGSNLGDRLANLRHALQALEKLTKTTVQQVSPVYLSDAMLPDNAPTSWDMPYLNLAVRCETSLDPLDLLPHLKAIEKSIGRKPAQRHWGPRLIDIDILAWDDLIIDSELLTLPHKNLTARPFALWPLADIAPLWKFPLAGREYGKTAAELAEKWGSRFSGQALFHTRQIPQRIDAPQWVGILNITPDSFSDGGQFLDTEKALAQAYHLVAAGAEVLDIGAESTGPQAKSLSPEQEWQRLQPVLREIQAGFSRFLLPPKISVDTYHAYVAEKALEFGADWVNDVTGLQDPYMREIVAASNADCVVMHSLAVPEDRSRFLPRDQDPVAAVYAWAEEQLSLLASHEISRERIILDVGIGYGKTAEQSLLLLQHIAVFQQLGVRLLVGHSRKSFINQFTACSAQERDLETVVISLFLAVQKVDYLRVHNVDENARALRVKKAL